MRCTLPAKSVLICIVLAVLLSACAGQLSDPGRKPPALSSVSGEFIEFNPRVPASDMWFSAGGGRLKKLRQFKGRVVLLNYWAPWCPPCRRELPTIDRLQGSLSGRAFTAVAVSIGKGGFTRARAFADELKLSRLTVWADPADKSRRSLPVRFALPMTIIIDRKGNMAGYHRGSTDWSTPQAMKFVTYYLDEK